MLLVQSERNALLASLSAVVGVVERRHTLPILSNLLLEKKGPKLTLLATDLELQVSTHLDAQAGEDFAITIAARKLGMKVSKKKTVFLAQGTDKAGACAVICNKLAKAGITMKIEQMEWGAQDHWVCS